LNYQLQSQGLAVSPASSAIVDATIIESAARPNKETSGIVIDREEDDSKEVVLGEGHLSKDPDARWLKKGKKSYFGYKAFIVTDSEDGFIRYVEVLPANTSEVRNLEGALGPLKPRRVYADKGYYSSENKELLRRKGIKNGIMYKAARNKALSRLEKVFNRLVVTDIW
ncbi:IS4/IS5 family transposase, partial [Rickettsiales endosymbiont of Peranema trichophorum]